jgi:hypothetical protein
MDWVAFRTAAAAVAACVAAIGAVGALLAITLQLQLDRETREVDYYRKLTPFLSFETSGVASPQGWTQAIKIYADGGGYAFNVLANIDQTNATSGGSRLVGQEVLRYLREDLSADPTPHKITFGRQAAEGFQGTLRVTFVDMFGVHHEAQQPVRIGQNDMA